MPSIAHYKILFIQNLSIWNYNSNGEHVTQLTSTLIDGISNNTIATLFLSYDQYILSMPKGCNST